jgi:hypothetical protein
MTKKTNMRSLVLKSCDISQNKITFTKVGFPKLNLLVVDCPNITDIIFTFGSAPKLEKIIWSSSTSLLGINKLPRLKEVEFNGDIVPNVVKEAIEKLKDRKRRLEVGEWEPQISFENFGPRLDPQPQKKTHTRSE